MDLDKYAALLAEVKPVIIETEEEFERMSAAVERLLEQGDALSGEEQKLLALLVFLTEAYGDELSEEIPSQPFEVLRELMLDRGVEAADLNDIFGNPRVVKDVLDGQRPITKGQAKQLGKLFAVSPRLFLTAEAE